MEERSPKAKEAELAAVEVKADARWLVNGIALDHLGHALPPTEGNTFVLLDLPRSAEISMIAVCESATKLSEVSREYVLEAWDEGRGRWTFIVGRHSNRDFYHIDTFQPIVARRLRYSLPSDPRSVSEIGLYRGGRTTGPE